MISCTQEQININEYPRFGVVGVQTETIGATFNAEIFEPGNESIKEHGFEWGRIAIDGAVVGIDRIYLCPLEGTTFSATVTRGMDENTGYSMRAPIGPLLLKITASPLVEEVENTLTRVPEWTAGF